MEAAVRRGAYGPIKHTELEYEKRHPGEVARHRAEGTSLRNFAVEVGSRMRAKQGAGPGAPISADTSVSQISCDPPASAYTSRRPPP
jgi:hypothetical protein